MHRSCERGAKINSSKSMYVTSRRQSTQAYCLLLGFWTGFGGFDSFFKMHHQLKLLMSVTALFLLVHPTSSTSSRDTSEIYPFMNITLPWDTRVEDLVNRLTLEEMVAQMAFGGGASLKPTPAIPRLGIKPYNFDTECLRGVMSTPGTAFPQSVGLAASFRWGIMIY